MRHRWLQRLLPLAVAAIFAAAVLALLRLLQQYDYHDIATRLGQLPPSNLWMAVGLTALSYALLTGYDFLGLRYVQRPVAFHRIAFASFISYVFSYNLGLSVMGGGAVRLRLYSSWGLSTLDIARLVAFAALTFWLGCLALAGIIFIAAPFPVAPALHTQWLTLQPLGLLLLVLVSAYVGICAGWSQRTLRLGSWELTVPPAPLALAQIALSALDCLLAAGVLYALMPALMPQGFISFLGMYLFAMVLAMLSHVPGGLGVFETVLVLQMEHSTPAPYVLGSLVAYRAIYYLLPFFLGASLLGGFEVTRRRRGLQQALSVFSRWIPEVVPPFLSVTVFIGGIILLVSGATPSIAGRAAWINDFLPLPIMEASHFFGSLAGVGLLFLARGLQRRLDAAYHLTVLLLAAGVVASLLKAFDYEEAITLSIMLAILVPCRSYFYRKASLFSERFTPFWALAVVVVLSGSVWLGFFSFKHVEYSQSLWWEFALDSDAPRFLRASVGASAALSALAIATLLRPGKRPGGPPGSEDLQQVCNILRQSDTTTGYLALLQDKQVLLSESRNAYVMYGVEGRSWVAMGDPVGAPSERQDLLWSFHDLVDLYGGWTVFYQVSDDNLSTYIELGLSVLKLGEEARVPLANFSLEGSGRKELRYVQRRLSKEGCEFVMLPAAAVGAVMPRLQAISDDWLERKNTREKGFSLGFFAADYLARAPVATVQRDGQIVAFANLWEGAPGTELSVDLMRNDSTAPAGVIDYLLLSVMLWGREQGYTWFNLGMAPFAGLSDRASASFWQRMGATLFLHGEHFYNFQGLRHYKNKFLPQWESRYLVSPGGLALPPIVTNIAALVSRGLRGTVGK